MKVPAEYEAAIEAVDREVCLLSEMEWEAVANGTTLQPLRASWSDLRRRLVVNPAPGASRNVQEYDRGTS